MNTTSCSVAIFGAEKQAATSAALARPDLRFQFITTQPVIDGWDLPNVLMHQQNSYDLSTAQELNIPLCARWVPALTMYTNRLGSFDLSHTMNALSLQFSHEVLPVVTDLCLEKDKTRRFIVKGNAWHRPDASIIGTILELNNTEEPYGCGLVYQEYWPAEKQWLVTGRRDQPGVMQLGVIRVHSEVCARDETLGAGETVHHPYLADLTSTMLEHLNHVGYFSANWLERAGEFRLTSIRPVARAVFGTLNRAGVDLLSPTLTANKIAAGGYRFTVNIHYSSYGSFAK